MPVAQLTLTEAQQAIANLWGTDWLTMSARMSEYGLTPAEMASNEFLRQWSGGAVEPIYARNGETILGYNFRADASTVRTGLNSNTSIVARGYVGHAPATTIETVGTNVGRVRVSRLSGIGSKVVTGASKLAVPLTLAAVGATLGKTIDETLYNANPDFWNSIGLETLNPQTWGSIAGGNEVGEAFINALFGIDPNTGASQAYIEQNALAYLAYCMNDAGIFAPATDSAYNYNIDTSPYIQPIPLTRDFYWQLTNAANPSYGTYFCYPSSIPDDCQLVIFNVNSNVNSAAYVVYCVSRTRYPSNVSPVKVHERVRSTDPAEGQDRTIAITQSYTFNDKTVYYGRIGQYDISSTQTDRTFTAGAIQQPEHYPMKQEVLWVAAFGEIIHSTGIEGIENQPNAVIPNFTGLSESDYLPYLQQTYPDMFNNAINYPVVQPDGSVTNYKYVPITLPNVSNPTTMQPTTNGATQQNPEIDPTTANQNLIDLLTKVLQQPMNEPISDTPQTPQNPTDTGDGSSPVPSFPIGSASSLWKIYHPTQAQINSFGGWLWSSDFIDQILKIFNNPMEAVIGLHKVYATPIDAGNATIKVGYLDSEIPSAYVEQQYIDVPCGTVNLYEQFGNVFDYSPFTDVKLYLPFVGIVPLNIADVMRSSISINYGVDILTGACLAQVTVNRDGNSSVLYQYSGNCAVQYPISSGSYMGIVSSIISVAGGIAATVASGGAAAPLALGAMGGIMGAHTSIQNSGGFSGNAGAMGGKIPYLIITRPQTKVADNAESLQGYRTNSYTTIGECSGYIKADSVHIINVNATDEELTEINNLILSGIII